MKVLEKGRQQIGWSIEHLCTGDGNGGGGCGAKLLIEQGDLFKTYNFDIDETTYITFKCSECGVLTDLSKLPSRNIKAMIPTQKIWEELHSGHNI